MGSADWMNRNLRGRVEVVFPVEDEELKRLNLSRVSRAMLERSAQMPAFGRRRSLHPSHRQKRLRLKSTSRKP